ncbi:conserved hypothetical protein [Burkholderia ambifaria MEX-5]|uniref:Uncharacterized protein n=1 Tax=Burkholderia ambifaria MEX-5 TaxID=396597 RepID=B1T5M8_9BURK|nr:conserved hypothetical protein [Burkholderia ambifaria MEX-5]
MRQPLIGRSYRRPHLKATFVRCLAILRNHRFANHLADVPGKIRLIAWRRSRIGWLGQCGAISIIVQIPERVHAAENIKLAYARPFRILDWIECGRRLRQAREQRSLRDREIGKTPGEIHVSRGAESVSALPKKNLIDV